MNNDPLITEKIYDAPISKVWKALTDLSEMQQWYFDIKEFRAVKDFEFEFAGGPPDKTYIHKCKVIEVVPQKKLSYSWTYEGYSGYSVVTFELFKEGNKTKLVLTHEGLDSFPKDYPEFSRDSFQQGWEHIAGISLKNYVEK